MLVETHEADVTRDDVKIDFTKGKDGIEIPVEDFSETFTRKSLNIIIKHC